LGQKYRKKEELQMNFTSLITLLVIIGVYSWQASRESKVGGATTWEHFKPSLERYSGFRELLLFVGFLLFYKLSRGLAIGDDATAFENAKRVVVWEYNLGILYELQIQQFFLDKTTLFKVINWVYIKLHIPTTILFFVWLFYRRRNYYLFIRNGFLIANVITLFFFVGFPCAPPRMLNDLTAWGPGIINDLAAMGIHLGDGFVDTLLEISEINLYKGVNSKLFNKYAAMPSMHFGNSLLIGIVVTMLTKNFLTKALIWLYPVFVLLVIVMTGNHFFLDAALGGFLVLFSYGMMLLLQKIFPSLKESFWGTERLAAFDAKKGG